MSKTKTKTLTLKQLRKALDQTHSQFIRLQASDARGYTVCATCDDPQPVPWSKLQCGHFVSRRHYFHRWDITEGNCAPQCVACNRFDQGRQWKLGQHIDAIHGPGRAAWLWSTRLNGGAMKHQREALTQRLTYMRAYVTARLIQIKQNKPQP